MNINFKKQSQFELFPGSPKNSTLEPGKPARLTKDLTLSLENIIVLCIIFVMVVVLFFSMGVEKGKKVALTSINPEAGTVVRQVETIDKSAAQKDSKSEESKTVVFPVDVPQEITEDADSVTRPPHEVTEEQENLFTIQVASFKLKANAQKEADRLKGVGHRDAFVIAKGEYSIVCVGKFAQRLEAKRFSNTLKKKYNDCLVRRL